MDLQGGGPCALLQVRLCGLGAVILSAGEWCQSGLGVQCHASAWLLPCGSSEAKLLRTFVAITSSTRQPPPRAWMDVLDAGDFLNPYIADVYEDRLLHPFYRRNRAWPLDCVIEVACWMLADNTE